MIKVAIEPSAKPEFVKAVTESGAVVVPLDQTVKALVWTDYSQPALLEESIDANPQLEWVQLPFAGVDAFSHIIGKPPVFTSAKGAYSEPVAEHVLALCLALGRDIPRRVRATSWGDKFAVSLYESHVLVLGGGGITEELLKLLAGFHTEITVVRNHPTQMPGATRTVAFAQLDEYIGKADFVVLAAALTDETRAVINQARLKAMKPTAYLINVARGQHVVTEDLVHALRTGVIAGAALDVTDPEPLPDGHPLWTLENCIITPHTADTPAQVTRMFAERIGANVKAYVQDKAWVGLVDKDLGY